MEVTHCAKEALVICAYDQNNVEYSINPVFNVTPVTLTFLPQQLGNL